MSARLLVQTLLILRQYYFSDIDYLYLYLSLMINKNIENNSTTIWNLAFKHLYALLFTAERGISRKPTIAILRLTKTATSILELFLCWSIGNSQ